MVSITIQLQNPYLILPNDDPNAQQQPNSQTPLDSAAPPSTSNLTIPSITNQNIPSSSHHTTFHNDQAPPTTTHPGTTQLRGTIILTLTKPIQVVSLAVKFDGSSNLSLSTVHPHSSAVIDKRVASYSRQHVRAQQFLIEPSPNPEHHVTLVAVNNAVSSAHETSTTTTTNTTTTPNPSESLHPNQIAYPFEINIPNNIPASVSTPNGSTTYKLTVELTMAKSPSAIMSLFSTARRGSGSGLTTTKYATSKILIYREGFLHSPPGALAPELGGTRNSGCGSDSCFRRNGLVDIEDRARPIRISGESSQSDGHIVGQLEHESNADIEENSLVSESISHNWPGYLNASIMLPFVQLPQKSKIELRVRIELEENHPSILIKYFQIELREKAIFRVGKIPKTQKVGSINHTTMAIVGIRERSISMQRLEGCWPTDSIPSDRLFEKNVKFTTPTSVRGQDCVSSHRYCNPSTYGRISKQERQNLEADANDSTTDLSKYKLGAIDIEIQHFLRCSISIKAKDSGPINRQLGDIPVIVRGVPSGTEYDCTGLPTYLGSFATSLPTSEERQSYENTTSSRICSEFEGCGNYSDKFATCLRSSLSNESEDGSILPRPFITESGLIAGDLDDSIYTSIMGLTVRTPPRYEEIMGHHLINSHFNELQSKSQINREAAI
ncbi:hypothetical protein BGZ76_007203 [Entomortierella beljakovae]|nr:hypothetical protein BGZ76_007203 [Entomortierella beljakovae]